MVVTSTNKHSTYGIACIQCREIVIAPEWSRYVSPRDVRHIWCCNHCGARFETSDHLQSSEHRRTVT
jgi:hypothetical protein